MDLDHRLGALGAPEELRVFALEFEHSLVERIDLPRLRSALPGCTLELSSIALTTPGAEDGGVEPLTPKKGTEFTVLGGGVGLIEDAELVGPAETSA